VNKSVFSLKIKLLCFFFSLTHLLHADWSPWDNLFYSDKNYANQIEVQTYILTQDQAAALVANPSEEPIQLIRRDLFELKRYLVARVRNLGEKYAWGVLNCTVPAIHIPMKIPIVSIQKQFCVYLICIDGSGITYSNRMFAPEVTFIWDQLYTK